MQDQTCIKGIIAVVSFGGPGYGGEILAAMAMLAFSKQLE
jgi:hypothetical protein